MKAKRNPNRYRTLAFGNSQKLNRPQEFVRKGTLSKKVPNRDGNAPSQRRGLCQMLVDPWHATRDVGASRQAFGHLVWPLG